jgi:hypothetical protein
MIDKEAKGDILLSFAPFFQIVVLMLQQILVDSNIVVHESFRIISIIVSGIPIILSMFYILMRKLTLFLISYLVVTFLVLVSSIFYPENNLYINSEVFYLLCINVPCFLCVLAIKNLNILKKVLFIISYIIFFLGIAYYALVWLGKINFYGYSMSYSYYLLLPALVFVNKKDISHLLAFLITCIMMLMLGSRGAPLIAIIYGFLILIIKSQKKIAAVIALGILCLGMSYNVLISLLTKFASLSGITSRTLDMLKEGNITDSSSRLTIYSTIWDKIFTAPLIGHGLYADRVVLNGLYCHNIFLEILYDFGILFGSLIFLLLLFGVYSAYKNSDKEYKTFFLLFMCFGLFPLFLSGSYLNFPQFGIFLGFTFNLVGKLKIINYTPKLTNAAS